MDIERTCKECGEDASYYCRLCDKHYCAEHLCHHLSVAWESNTWTNRNKGDFDEPADTQNPSDEGLRHDTSTAYTVSAELQNNEKPLASYSSFQLEEQYRLCLLQARRIRAELEQRGVFASRVDMERGDRERNTPALRVPRRRTLPKGPAAAVDILLGQVRHGSITIDQVIARIRALVPTS